MSKTLSTFRANCMLWHFFSMTIKRMHFFSCKSNTHQSIFPSARQSSPNLRHISSQSCDIPHCRQRCQFSPHHPVHGYSIFYRFQTQPVNRAYPNRIAFPHGILAGERNVSPRLLSYQLICDRNAVNRWRMVAHRRKCIYKNRI